MGTREVEVLARIGANMARLAVVFVQDIRAGTGKPCNPEAYHMIEDELNYLAEYLHH